MAYRQQRNGWASALGDPPGRGLGGKEGRRGGSAEQNLSSVPGEVIAAWKDVLGEAPEGCTSPQTRGKICTRANLNVEG